MIVKVWHPEGPHECSLPISRNGEPAPGVVARSGRPVASRAMAGAIARCDCGQWWECRLEVYNGERLGVWWRISRHRGERLHRKWAKKHHGA